MATQNQANDDKQSPTEPASSNRSIPSNATTSNNTSANADLPGRRLKNPLSEFTSYTYQLTLYMVTPDAYNLFLLSDRKNINGLRKTNTGNTPTGGAFIVAQSGGINTKTTDRNAPGINLDYYIDDLKISQALTGKATESAINITTVSFTITEPYGFSFNSELFRSFEQIKKTSKIESYRDSGNQWRQHFILGVRFQGYTPDGTPATPDKFFASDTFNPSESASGVFERFFDIIIESVKFRIDGSMTKYAVQARATSPNIAFGQKYGVVDNIVSIEAATVDEALNSLTNSLNKNQQGTHIQYEIAYLGDAGPIKIASMINPGDPDKGKQPGVAGPTNSSQVNTKTATEAITDTSKRIIQIEQGTSVTQAIGQIIKQSSYLRDALTMTYTTAETPSNSTASPEITLNKNPPREIQWYNLGARVEPLAWDKKVGDFSYKITYVIQPFKTPGTFTPYGKTSKYYGPHKRYNYWFTGKNTEILEFTQTLDGSYFNIAFTPSSDPNSPTYIPGLDIPSIPGKLNDYERSNSLGRGAEAENQYLTNLYSPKDWSEAKIKILGDPDFLMNDTPGSLNEVYRQYYGNDGFTINPNSGLVFIELNFNEAKDYDNRTGLLNVNEKILFWIDPTNSNFKSNINGIAYLVSQVDSMFSGGSFTQTITCKMSPIPYTQSSTNETSRENDNTPVGDTRTGSSQGSTATTTPSAGGTVSQNNGFRQPQDDATGVDAQVKRIQESTQSQPSTNPPRTIPTNFGIVANDDSTPYDSTTQAGVAATTTQTGIGTTRVAGLINGGRTQTGIGTTRVTGLINGGGTR